MGLIQLKGGTFTEDPRLDRIVHYDERSLAYPVRALVGDAPIRRKTWRLDIRLDQGREGACVGFAWAHEIAAAPATTSKATDPVARSIYREAQKIDPWPGEAYEGTSVLAGCQIAQRLGAFEEYRWAFSVDDVLRAVSNEGPVVMGTLWTEGMYQPGLDGYLRVEGRVVGGHAWLLRGVDPTRERVLLSNSWGRSFGMRGDAWVRFSDLERLLHEDGEACVPIRRRRPTL